MNKETEKAGIMLFRSVTVLLGLMLTFGFSNAAVDYQKVQKAVELSAIEIDVLFSDLKRYGNTESQDIIRNLFDYLEYMLNDGWKALAEGRKDDTAWRLFYDIEDSILNLQPDSQLRHTLKSKLIRNIDELSDHRHTTLYVVENPPTGFHWVVIFIFAFSCFLYSVIKSRMPILVFLLGYSIMIGIVFYSNISLTKPFQGHYRVHRTSYQMIYDGLVAEPGIMKILEFDKQPQ
jgi:hypothetical protein